MFGGGEENKEPKKGGEDLAPHVASTLCYVCAPITSLIFLLIEKENKEIRFHAWQATFFGGAIIAVTLLLNLLGLLMGRIVEFMGDFVTNFVVPIVWIGAIVLWTVCLIKAYQGERWKIPVLGDIAAQKAKL